MSALSGYFGAADFFLRADPAGLRAWFTHQGSRLVWLCLLGVVSGAGVYGVSMGWWWAPLQACYVGIKLPLLLLLTALGNGLLNGMLAPLLGLNISFKQSLTAVLVSFAYAGAVLGALAPVALFVDWNTPPLSAATRAVSPEYAFLQLTHVACIAFAGVVGNVRLLPLLKQLAGSVFVARKVFVAWLAGNLFLGSQLCWVLRPFIWDPAAGVQFIGRQNLHGNFFETVFQAAQRLMF